MKQLRMNTRSTTKAPTAYVMTIPTPSEDVQTSSNITINVLDAGKFTAIKPDVFLLLQAEVTIT